MLEEFIELLTINGHYVRDDYYHYILYSTVKSYDTYIILKEIKPEISIHESKTIKTLDLSRRRIDFIDITKIPRLHLTRLDTLYIRFQPISKIENLDNLVSLTSLDLSNNDIKTINGLENLTNLILLNLDHNNITSISGLETLTNLVFLNLNNNKIKTMENLETLITLKELDLSFNKIKTIENLETLINIRKISISNNRIETIKNLESLTKLGILNISNNYLTKNDIGGLRYMLSLYHVNLIHNRINSTEKIDIIWYNMQDTERGRMDLLLE